MPSEQINISNPKLHKGKNDLETLFPEIAKEWDYEKNKPFLPSQFTDGTSRKVWWICSVCGNSFEQRINHRTKRHNSCPKCARKNCQNTRIESYIKKNGSLADTDLISQWDYDANQNIDPGKITKNSSKVVSWKCDVCGYKWKAKVNNRFNGRGCPACSNKVVISGVNDLATVMPDIAKEWHPTKNGNLKPTDVTKGCGKKVWWLCPFGHEYQTTILHRTFNKGTNCPVCNSGRQTSFNEQAVFYYVKKYFPDAINRYKSEWLGSMELDIYIPSIKWAIEYDGCAWHKKDKFEREVRKYKLCNANEVRLLRIKESELNENVNQSCDSAIHVDDLEKPEKLNELIYLVLSEFISIKIVYLDIDVNVERDRFEILKDIQNNLKVSLLSEYPEIAKEWHPTKNGNSKPNMFKSKSNFKAYWLCSKCGYEYIASIGHRTSGTSCPVCGRKIVDDSKKIKVARINLRTGEIEKVYESITDASKELNINGSNITTVCKGGRKQAGGFGWKYF